MLFFKHSFHQGCINSLTKAIEDQDSNEWNKLLREMIWPVIIRTIGDHNR